jgi:hypothetical protein
MVEQVSLRLRNDGRVSRNALPFGAPLDLLARQVICNWSDNARIARRQYWRVH